MNEMTMAPLGDPQLQLRADRNFRRSPLREMPGAGVAGHQGERAL